MALPKQIRLVLVTPEKTLLDELVDSLQFPLYDGQMGVFPGHTPLVGRLGYGPLTVVVGDQERLYYIDGGFVQIKGEVLTLLTNRAIPAAEIDRQAAEEQLRRATELVATTDHEFAAKERELVRSRQMLAVARKR